MASKKLLIGQLSHLRISVVMPILEAYLLTNWTSDQIGQHTVVLIISYMVKNTIQKKLVMLPFAVGYLRKNGKRQVKILPWHIIFHMATGLGNLTKQMDRRRCSLRDMVARTAGPRTTSKKSGPKIRTIFSPVRATMVEGEANFTYHHIDYNFKLR